MRGARHKPPENLEGMTLQEYLADHDVVVRRGEMWAVINVALELHERRKVHNRWYNRWIRKVRRFFNQHLSLHDLPHERDDFPEPTVDQPDITANGNG